MRKNGKGQNKTLKGSEAKKTQYIPFFVYNINHLLTKKPEQFREIGGFNEGKRYIRIYLFYELYIPFCI